MPPRCFAPRQTISQPTTSLPCRERAGERADVGVGSFLLVRLRVLRRRCEGGEMLVLADRQSTKTRETTRYTRRPEAASARQGTKADRLVSSLQGASAARAAAQSSFDLRAALQVQADVQQVGSKTGIWVLHCNSNCKCNCFPRTNATRATPGSRVYKLSATCDLPCGNENGLKAHSVAARRSRCQRSLSPGQGCWCECEDAMVDSDGGQRMAGMHLRRDRRAGSTIT